MKKITVDLYEYFNQSKEYDGGILNGSIRENDRPVMLIIPGGAYSFLCYRENKPFEKKFYDLGYNAFYLDYSVGDNVRYGIALKEVLMAITYIRKNFSSKLGIIGFSAGGHLVGESCNGEKDLSFLGENKDYYAKPDATVYCYPVVSTKEGLIHEWSFQSLLKDKFESLKDKVSVENLINNESSPAFIFHCADDSVVPVGNSIELANAYLKNGVKVELHVFPRGGHGVALPTLECFTEEELKNVNINKELTVWFDLCLNFLKNNGI